MDNKALCVTWSHVSLSKRKWWLREYVLGVQWNRVELMYEYIQYVTWTQSMACDGILKSPVF